MYYTNGVNIPLMMMTMLHINWTTAQIVVNTTTAEILVPSLDVTHVVAVCVLITIITKDVMCIARM